MTKQYAVTCPKCKETRQTGYQEYYRAKTGKTTGICAICRGPIRTDGNLCITCPECKEIRQVSKQIYLNHRRGKITGRCRVCGALAQKVWKREKVKTIESCGCVLTGTKCNARCAKFETCKHRSECLHALFALHWDGFTADCRGFNAKAPKDPFDQIRLQI